MSLLPTETWVAPIRALRAFRYVVAPSSDPALPAGDPGLYPVTVMGAHYSREQWRSSSFIRAGCPKDHMLEGHTQPLVDLENCFCGLHAFKPSPVGLSELIAYGRQANTVIGQVELAGTVIEHEHGYRATMGRISGLYARAEWIYGGTKFARHDRVMVAEVMDRLADPTPYRSLDDIEGLPVVSLPEMTTALMLHYRRRDDGQDWETFAENRDRDDAHRAARASERARAERAAERTATAGESLRNYVEDYVKSYTLTLRDVNDAAVAATTAMQAWGIAYTNYGPRNRFPQQYPGGTTGATDS